MWFHDIRHATATLLLQAGDPIQHVQRILCHANARTAVDTYGHLCQWGPAGAVRSAAQGQANDLPTLHGAEPSEKARSRTPPRVHRRLLRLPERERNRHGLATRG